MVNLLELEQYSEQTKNTDALAIIKSYIKTTEESWTKGKYYFGGQIPLDITENITNEHLNIVQEKNNSAITQGACNSWENMSMSKSFHEFDVLKELINKCQKSIH